MQSETGQGGRRRRSSASTSSRYNRESHDRVFIFPFLWRRLSKFYRGILMEEEEYINESIIFTSAR